MPTPAGTIKFSDIETEFGRNGSKSLGAYRISQSAGLWSNLPLDSGVPQSGPISFSQMRGKRLNMVVDISGGEEYRVNMRTKYDTNSGVTVIGGFRSKPADPSQTRIYVSINKTIGSSTESANHVALRTGNWGTSTILEVLLGGSAEILGAGGKGGDFRADQYFVEVQVPQYEDGNQVYYYDSVTDSYYPVYNTEIQTVSEFYADGGASGSSAFGVEYPCTVYNYGLIQAGYGGGGAGAYRSR